MAQFRYFKTDTGLRGFLRAGGEGGGEGWGGDKTKKKCIIHGEPQYDLFCFIPPSLGAKYNKSMECFVLEKWFLQKLEEYVKIR